MPSEIPTLGDEDFPVIREESFSEFEDPKIILERLREEADRQDAQRKNVEKERIESTGLRCLPCGFDIVVENYYDYRFADSGFIGPQTSNMSLRYYCGNCGIVYEGEIIRKKMEKKQKSG